MDGVKFEFNDISLYTRNDSERRRFVGLGYFINFELKINLQTFEISMNLVNILTLNAYKKKVSILILNIFLSAFRTTYEKPCIQL